MTAGAVPIARAGLPAPLRDAFEALDRSGVRWSLLRPRSALAHSQGDIDVLVDPGSLGSVADALDPLGFVAMPRPGPDVHAVAFDEGAGEFVWLHLQVELHVGGESLPAAAILDRVVAGELPEPPGDWLLWILLLRALVDRGELPERHRRRVLELAREWEGGPPTLVELARRRGIDPDAVVAAAEASDWDRLLSQTRRRSRPGPPGRFGMLALRLRRLARLSERRGLSVAVLGPDGAGKSSLVAALDRTLPGPTSVQYMGLTGGVLPRVDKLRVPGIVFAGHVAVLWGRYARSWYRRARGEIVIFDRYTLDGAVPSGRQLTAAGRLSRRLQRWSCPMPDIVLLLDASGETMFARSGAYGPDVLESWRAAYSRLEGRVRVLQKLDAERPADQVLRDAQARIWRRYHELRSPSPTR